MLELKILSVKHQGYLDAGCGFKSLDLALLHSLIFFKCVLVLWSIRVEIPTMKLA